ncbi:hypothetical protein Megpolyxen_01713 (plasmid) [Candidatus Megaera polyxenophila]|nr:hypothetical protein Megpolyxen_01713 [Candidatus Megaera polyxenophila]
MKKSIQILKELTIPYEYDNNEEQIEWFKSNIYLIDTIIQEIEALGPNHDVDIGEINIKRVIDFSISITSILSKSKAIHNLNIIFLESGLSNQAKTIHKAQLAKVKNLYLEVIDFLEGKKKVINNPENIPIPNHIIKAMTKQQKGIIGDIKEKTERETFIKTLENTIRKDYKELPDIAKQEISKIDNKYEISKYLGSRFKSNEILTVRSLLVILYRKLKSGNITDPDKNDIYIPWKEIYEECGISIGKSGGYETRLTKPIREAILSKEGNLAKKRWVKDEGSDKVIMTSFLLEVKPLESKVGLRFSSFLFSDKKKLEKSTMIDNKGFVRFRKVNRSEIGLNLFLYLERYISQQDSIKTLDLNTIIKIFNLQSSYLKNKKRTVYDIERVFDDMVSQQTILSSWKKQEGINGQQQYEFVNLRYKKTEHKIPQEKQINLGKIINITTKKVTKKLNKNKKP